MSAALTAIGEVVDVVRGITFKPEDLVPLGSPDSVACLRTKNVQTSLDLSDVWAVPRLLVRRSDQFVSEGDILVSTANSWNLVGKCCWVPRLELITTLGGFISALRAKRDLVDPRYLYHWFSSPPVQAEVRSCARQTTNISNLSLDQCLEIKMPLPSLKEQRRIAIILDQANDLFRMRIRALERIEALASSVFVELFGDPVTNSKNWTVRELGMVASFYGGTTLPAGIAFNGQSDGALLVKVSDMNAPGNEIELRTAQLWSKLPGSGAATCPEGAVVIPKRGGAIGTNKKRITIRPSVLDPNVMGIKGKPEFIGLAYLYHWFLRLDLNTLTNGSSVPQLNKKDLVPLRIAVPPAHVQRQFATSIENLTEVRSLQHSHLARLDALFASLQHRAFIGELASKHAERELEMAG
jgi:type I restriction enzyme S subunit